MHTIFGCVWILASVVKHTLVDIPRADKANAIRNVLDRLLNSFILTSSNEVSRAGFVHSEYRSSTAGCHVLSSGVASQQRSVVVVNESMMPQVSLVTRLHPERKSFYRPGYFPQHGGGVAFRIDQVFVSRHVTR